MTPLPLSTRACGSCTACCTVKRIVELALPQWTRCPHECAAGCNVYAARPPTCRAYNCSWLLGDIPGDERQRPDRLGLIFDVVDEGCGAQSLVAWEVWPGASYDRGPARLLAALRQQATVTLIPHVTDTGGSCRES